MSSSAVPRRVVVATDKFRSTASAPDLVTTIRAALGTNLECDAVIVSDGGEGFRHAFVGDTVSLRVRGPWGEVHDAPMTRLRTGDETIGVLEVAEIIGRDFREAPSSADALAASSAGVGDALVLAANHDVDRVVVGCGGSATSDGGEGCYDVWRDAGLDVALTGATDITATFLGALRYAEQKGVDASDVGSLEHRLREVAARYERECARDVVSVERTGAAGGLAGALYALGADLVSGFEEVARANRLAERIARAQLVITGEGRVDAGSLEGKVVTGVCALTTESQRVLVVCGAADADAVLRLQQRYPWVQVHDLVSRFGERRAREETLACVAAVVGDYVGR
ncbi:MAG TPA: glycerate kinase [Acidimicrobiales bacterium]